MKEWDKAREGEINFSTGEGLKLMMLRPLCSTETRSRLISSTPNYPLLLSHILLFSLHFIHEDLRTVQHIVVDTEGYPNGTAKNRCSFSYNVFVGFHLRNHMFQVIEARGTVMESLRLIHVCRCRVGRRKITVMRCQVEILPILVFLAMVLSSGEAHLVAHHD